MAYGIEAVVPIELKVPTHQVQFNDESLNDGKLISNLDTLKEIRDEAQIQIVAF